TCRRLLDGAGDKLVLPDDVVVARELSDDAETQTVAAAEIPDGWKGLDIGPATVARFGAGLGKAAPIFWNGPMGVFELSASAAGTRGLAEAVAEATAASKAFSVIGGGDSAAAVRQLGLDAGAFSHISTGGGASLEFLEGKQLPGIAVLED